MAPGLKSRARRTLRQLLETRRRPVVEMPKRDHRAQPIRFDKAIAASRAAPGIVIKRTPSSKRASRKEAPRPARPPCRKEKMRRQTDNGAVAGARAITCNRHS